jgi:hypothetical protein
MNFQDVAYSIVDTLREMDGSQIAVIHNTICSRKIKYDETISSGSDDWWEYIDECVVDSDGCLKDNNGDAETNMEHRR